MEAGKQPEAETVMAPKEHKGYGSFSTLVSFLLFRGVILFVSLVWVLSLSICAAAANPPADSWITNAAQYPPRVANHQVRSNAFGTLRAEVIAGRLKIFWPPERPGTNAVVIVHASADEPGHWPARDWRSYPMTLRGQTWETAVPVTDLDVPLLYFVSSSQSATTGVSPMRLCRPREAGLEEPTRIFWPFLEGFEEDTEGWQLLTPDAAPLKADTTAHTGRAALLVSLPAGKRSVTVATTRARGWHFWRQNATGLRVWLRTREGTGRARFTVLANARATNEVVAVFSQEPTVNDQWQKTDLPLAEFPKLSLAAVDLLTIEFIGEGPRDFLVDDLQLLGPWKRELE